MTAEAFFLRLDIDALDAELADIYASGVIVGGKRLAIISQIGRWRIIENERHNLHKQYVRLTGEMLPKPRLS